MKQCASANRRVGPLANPLAKQPFASKPDLGVSGGAAGRDKLPPTL
jgi:hypothetical protein